MRLTEILYNAHTVFFNNCLFACIVRTGPEINVMIDYPCTQKIYHSCCWETSLHLESGLALRNTLISSTFCWLTAFLGTRNHQPPYSVFKNTIAGLRNSTYNTLKSLRIVILDKPLIDTLIDITAKPSLPTVPIQTPQNNAILELPDQALCQLNIEGPH